MHQNILTGCMPCRAYILLLAGQQTFFITLNFTAMTRSTFFLMRRLMMVILPLIALAACEEAAAPKSRTELLTQAVWKMVKVERKTGNGPWVDLSFGYSPCEQDNYFIYRTNGLWELNEGAAKCNAGDPQVMDYGAWSFFAGESQLLLTDVNGATVVLFNIEQLTETELVVFYSRTYNGVTYTNRITYGH
jgi:hypothetical protein